MNPMKKLDILNVATNLFARHGFKKTSMDEIAREARIGKATIYQHFTSKEEVLAMAVRRESEDVVQSLIRAVNSVESPEDKIRAFVRDRMSMVQERVKIRQMSNEVLQQSLTMVRKAHQAWFNREVRLLQQVLERGREAGRFQVTRPHQVALMFISSLAGLDSMVASGVNGAELQQGLEATVEIFIRGLLASS